MLRDISTDYRAIQRTVLANSRSRPTTPVDDNSLSTSDNVPKGSRVVSQTLTVPGPLPVHPKDKKSFKSRIKAPQVVPRVPSVQANKENVPAKLPSAPIATTTRVDERGHGSRLSAPKRTHRAVANDTGRVPRPAKTTGPSSRLPAPIIPSGPLSRPGNLKATIPATSVVHGRLSPNLNHRLVSKALPKSGSECAPQPNATRIQQPAQKSTTSTKPHLVGRGKASGPPDVAEVQQGRVVANSHAIAPRAPRAVIPPLVTGQGTAAAIGAALSSRIPGVAGSRIGQTLAQLQAQKRQREDSNERRAGNSVMDEVRELKKMRMVSGSAPVQEDKKQPQAAMKKSLKGKGKERAPRSPAFMQTFGQTMKAAVSPQPPTILPHAAVAINSLKRPFDGGQNQTTLKRAKLVHLPALPSATGARQLAWKQRSRIPVPTRKVVPSVAGPSRPRPPLPAAFGKRAGIPTTFKRATTPKVPQVDSRDECIVLVSPSSEYSQRNDDSFRTDVPDWAQGEALKIQLRQQKNVDLRDVFGPIRMSGVLRMLPGEARRPRGSSIVGVAPPTQLEKDEYDRRLGLDGGPGEVFMSPSPSPSQRQGSVVVKVETDDEEMDLESPKSCYTDRSAFDERPEVPIWAQGEVLRAQLQQQRTVDPESVFGQMRRSGAQKIFPEEARRNRGSSIVGVAPPTQEEIDSYNRRMGRDGGPGEVFDISPSPSPSQSSSSRSDQDSRKRSFSCGQKRKSERQDDDEELVPRYQKRSRSEHIVEADDSAVIYPELPSIDSDADYSERDTKGWDEAARTQGRWSDHFPPSNQNILEDLPAMLPGLSRDRLARVMADPAMPPPTVEEVVAYYSRIGILF